MSEHKYKVGDLVCLTSKSKPEVSGDYFVRGQVLPSDRDINARTGTGTSEPLYLLEGLGGDLWAESSLTLIGADGGSDGKSNP